MLLTLNTLKAMLGVSGTGEDAQLGALLRAADSFVKQYCCRDFERNRVQEYYSGTNTQSLVLRQRPVVQVFEVRMDTYGDYGQSPGGFPDSSILIPGKDYELRLENDSSGFSESGVLHRINYVWPILNRVSILGKLTAEISAVRGNIWVDYSYGFDPTLEWPDPLAVPPALTTAVVELVALWRRNWPQGGSVIREKLGRWEVELAPQRRGMSLPDGFNDLLEPFREINF